MDQKGCCSTPRRRLLTAAACGLAGLLAGCDSAPPPVAATPLRIGIDLWAGYYPLLLARELGYLSAAGVEVDIGIPENTRRLLSDFSAGAYDGVCVSLGDMITLTRTSPDIRMVLASDESTGADVILGRKVPANAAAVRGKRIGTSLGGFGELLVLRFLARFGLTFDDVKLLNTDAADVQAQLEKGEIDFGHTWEPYVSLAERRGFVPVFSSADTPGLIIDGLIFHSAVIELRRSAIHALLVAWFRALEWWNGHPEEGDQRLLLLLKGKVTDVSRDGLHLLGVADNRARFQPGHTDTSAVHAADQFVEHFVARGYLMRRPRPAELFDPSMLP